MKNVTLSAEESLIELARKKAARQGETLNTCFRRWLRQYTRDCLSVDGYLAMMRDFGEISAGGPYSRDELNER